MNKPNGTLYQVYYFLSFIIRSIKENIFLFLIWTLTFNACLVFIYSKTKPQYKAETTFIIDNGGGGGPSLLMGMASQFGFGSSGGNSIGVSKEQILKIVESHRILNETFLSKSIIKGKDAYIIDHIINQEAFFSKFNNVNIDFNTPNHLRDSILRVSRKHIIDNHLDVAISKEEIISIKSNFTNEELCYEFNTKLIENLLKYFRFISSEKDRLTYQRLSDRIDSINHDLTFAEELYAQTLDSKGGVYAAVGRLEDMRYKRNMEILQVMYVEGLKNLELAKFNLVNNSSLVQVIDKPFYPLEINKGSLIKTVVVGLIIGLVLFIVFLILKDILKQLKNNID